MCLITKDKDNSQIFLGVYLVSFTGRTFYQPSAIPGPYFLPHSNPPNPLCLPPPICGIPQFACSNLNIGSISSTRDEITYNFLLCIEPARSHQLPSDGRITRTFPSVVASLSHPHRTPPKITIIKSRPSLMTLASNTAHSSGMTPRRTLRKCRITSNCSTPFRLTPF